MTRRKSLTNEQVREIRKLHLGYVVGYQTLAKRFGVGASTIRDVVKFYTYAGIV
jgi:transposase